MHCGELEDHLGAPWIVECTPEPFVSLLQEPRDIEVAFMIGPGSIQAKGFDLVKNALAESLQSKLPKFAKYLPV